MLRNNALHGLKLLVLLLLASRVKGKGKFHPITGLPTPEVERRYISTLSWTSALERVGGQLRAPSVLPPVKTRYPLYRRLGRPQGRSGQVWKISPPTGIQSPERPARSYSLCRLSCRNYISSVPEVIWLHILTVIQNKHITNLNNFRDY
jgi:hypothetical protein